MAVAQSHGGPLSLICVSARESSPVEDVVETKSDAKKKRFHPFRNLRRIFRRKSRQLDVADAAAIQERVSRTLEPRCSSTGRLIDEEINNARRRSSSLAPGLSLSHDSVFNPEKTDSGHSSSDLENSSLSIPILIPTARFQAELADVVRRRIRDDSDDEDLGLPRSRCSSLAADFPDKLGDRTVKSQSSCSEGSLLSTGSSLEDDLQFTGQASDLDLKVTKHKLSHSAAKHKMAVRPRRNHGAPGAKRAIPKSLTSLPATPEVNEDSGAFATVTAIDAPSAESNPELSLVPESSTLTVHTEAPHGKVPAVLIAPLPLRPETWSKSASLPHGAALSSTVETKVARSFSSAGATKGSESLPPEDFKYPRDALDGGEKKRAEVEKKQDLCRIPVSKSLTRSAERRQRVDPVDIPAGPVGYSRMRISYSTSPPKPTWPISTSPPVAVRPELSSNSSTERISHSAKHEPKPDPKFDSYTEKSNHHIKFEANSDPKIDCFTERTSLYIKNDSKLRRESAKPPIQKSQSFHKDVPAPVYHFASSLPKNLGDEDSNKRLYLKNKNLGKFVRKEDKDSLNSKLTKKSASLESIGSNNASGGSLSTKSASSESIRSIVVTHEEPRYANLKTFLLNNYDQIHHGYENIEIIELVRKEKEATEQTLKSKVNFDSSVKERKPEPDSPKIFENKLSLERPSDGVVRGKEITGKSLETAEKGSSPGEKNVPEFMRIQLKEPKGSGKLVERRKSELLLTDELDLNKPLTRSFRKQVSLQDNREKEKDSQIKRPVSLQESKQNKETEIRNKPSQVSKPGDNVVIVEKQEEVVFRRKSQAKEGEEPELMKVFARRSLKIKDDDKDADEDAGRTRDSDKENEIIENVRDEKKITIDDTHPPILPTKPAAPLKPAVMAKNGAVGKFVRNLSETASEGGKTITEIKNKVNGSDKPNVTNNIVIAAELVPKKKSLEMKISAVKDIFKESERSSDVETHVLIKGGGLEKLLDSVKVSLDRSDDVEEIVDEPGFKRIQDRRAEWERRLQAAK